MFGRFKEAVCGGTLQEVRTTISHSDSSNVIVLYIDSKYLGFINFTSFYDIYFLLSKIPKSKKEILVAKLLPVSMKLYTILHYDSYNDMKYISFLFLALLLTFIVKENEGDKVGV